MAKDEDRKALHNWFVINAMAVPQASTSKEQESGLDMIAFAGPRAACDRSSDLSRADCKSARITGSRYEKIKN
jgi:hypothetical protein